MKITIDVDGSSVRITSEGTLVARDEIHLCLTTTLSKRELEVLGLLSHGHSAYKIALLLYTTEKTIRNHTNSIYSKLHVNNRVQAIRQGIKLGLISI